MGNRRYVSLKETNQHIRAALKQAFPGVKFSVVGDSYAGGASTNVRYVDGPPVKDVEAVVKFFAGATFDGMIDLKEYVSRQFGGEEVHFGADFVFVNRSVSDHYKELALALLEADSQKWHGKSFDPQGPAPDFPQVCYEKGVPFHGSYQYYGQQLVEGLAHALADEGWAVQSSAEKAFA